MKSRIMKNLLKLIVVIIIVVLFVWFLMIKPTYTFKKYEKQVEEAARKYYDLNPTHLPTGNRVATVGLQQLYSKAFLKEDIFVPYSKKPCSVTDSWVKVVKKDNDYKYVVYLKCGVIESKVDHTGPTITLKGKENMIVERNTKFTDPGIKSVIDKSDGKIAIENVKVSGTVDTSKVDTYEIKYTAVDYLGNKSIATRKVTIQESLANTIKGIIKDGYYKGDNVRNNYIRLSNMLFRIIKLDSNDNIIAIANEDVANINYSKIDDWLNNYYINLFTDKSKEYLVKNKYCKTTPSSKDLNKCDSYTNERYFYIVNTAYINKTKNEDGSTFLKPETMTWVASENNKLHVTRNVFINEYYGKDYYPVEKTDNYGIRPLITIKGKSNIISGDGSRSNPYSFEENPKAKGGVKLNTRYVGEYIRYSGYLWRIIETPKDGTTKVIMMDTVLQSNQEPIKISYSKENIYNPTEKGNIGYYINNKLSEYINTSYFVNHQIKVKIYDKHIVYNEEKTTNKYSVKLSAPDMYEIFSAGLPYASGGNSYWMTNSTSDGSRPAVISEVSAVINEEISNTSYFGIRPVGYLKEDIVISSGKGTEELPYIIKR